MMGEREERKLRLISSVHRVIRYSEYCNPILLHELIRNANELENATNAERENELCSQIEATINKILEETFMLALFNESISEETLMNIIAALKR